jgi:hypothetical protein
VARDIIRARELKEQLEAAHNGQMDPEIFGSLQGKIHDYSVSTVCDKRELFWRRHVINFRFKGILRVLCEKPELPHSE